MAMKFHPASEKLPMLGPTELQELADDITANGLHSPIELYEGMIIDGRNRYEACRIADVEPDFITIDAFSIGNKPFAYVWSMNGTRRHLTPSQKAMAGQELLSEERAEAKERQKDHGNTAPGRKNTCATGCTSVGRARDIVAGKVGVSHTLIDAADKVATHGTPELAKLVTNGELSVTTAAKLTTRPKREQTRIAKKGPKAVMDAAKAGKPPSGESNGFSEGATPATSKSGQQKKDPRLWGRWDEAFGKLKRLTDDLNRSFPHFNLHKQLTAHLNSAHTARTDWMKASK